MSPHHRMSNDFNMAFSNTTVFIINKQSYYIVRIEKTYCKQPKNNNNNNNTTTIRSLSILLCEIEDHVKMNTSLLKFHCFSERSLIILQSCTLSSP